MAEKAEGTPNVCDWRQPEMVDSLWASYEHSLSIVFGFQESGQMVIEPWNLKVLYGLLQSGLHALRHIRRGWPEEDMSLLAWSARNILELELWTEFVTLNTENALRFHQDWLNDVAGMMERSDPNVSVPYDDMDYSGVDVETAQASIAKEHAASSELPKQYLRISNVAKLLGKELEFSRTNPIYSKFIHPTAFSVLSFPSERTRTNISTLFLHNGCMGLMRILITVDTYLRAVSLPHILDSAPTGSSE